MDRRLAMNVIADLEAQRDAIDGVIQRLRDHVAVAATRPSNGRWTDAEDELAERMATVDGKTHAEIASVLGRTTEAVAQRLSRLRRGT